MVILLSIYNGFEDIVHSQQSLGDPEIRISPTLGKVFHTDSIDMDALRNTEGVAAISTVMEEGVLVEYRGSQTTAILRGVDSTFTQVVPIDRLIVDGQYELQFGDIRQAVVGQGLAWSLGIRTSLISPLVLYTPNRGSISTLLPISAAKSDRLFPEGIFALDANHDGAYLYSTLDFAQSLFDYPDRATWLAVAVEEGASPEKVASNLAEQLGEGFKVDTRERQNASLYRIMQYEKWGVFFIILLVMIIASFSIIGSLVMLIIDKRADIFTLGTMGADLKLVRTIFEWEGMIISMVGAMGGLILGLAVSLVQQYFGLIKIGAESFVFDAYPVRVEVLDIIGIAASVIAVNYIITKFTVRKALPKEWLREKR